MFLVGLEERGYLGDWEGFVARCAYYIFVFMLFLFLLYLLLLIITLIDNPILFKLFLRDLTLPLPDKPHLPTLRTQQIKNIPIIHLLNLTSPTKTHKQIPLPQLPLPLLIAHQPINITNINFLSFRNLPQTHYLQPTTIKNLLTIRFTGMIDEIGRVIQTNADTVIRT